MKGIIMAGGTGSRLWPTTLGVSKQLLCIYDKPMIYFPLTTLMLAGIRDILVITTPYDQVAFQAVLGDGSQWGISLSYATQAAPKGLAEAFIIGQAFIDNDPVALILGDNIFYGHGLPELLYDAKSGKGATIFSYRVADPYRYGVVELDSTNTILSIEEKPSVPKSMHAVTGLYFYDDQVVSLAKSLKPSLRNELEITDINKLYLQQNRLYNQPLGRGFAWFDTGTSDSLLGAANYVATIQKQQGIQIASPDEIAYRQGWITQYDLTQNARKFKNNSYGNYLQEILAE